MHRAPWLLPSLVLATACAQAARQSPAPDSPTVAVPTEAKDEVAASPLVPRDPAVRTGTLANGLTYYIRKHDKPKDRISMWLAVDAGSRRRQGWATETESREPGR